jgi:phage-related tail protein
MASKNLHAKIIIGGAVTGALKSALGSTRDGITKIGKAVTDLNSRQRDLNGVIRDQERLGKAGSALKVAYAQQELGVINKQIDALKRKQSVINAMKERRANARAGMAQAGVMIGAGMATLAALGKPIKDAAAFETAMLGVAKQVEGARDSAGKLTTVYHDMRKQVQQLGNELPIATNEIAGMVAAGARALCLRLEAQSASLRAWRWPLARSSWHSTP